MNIGIVGNEAAKFDRDGETDARSIIRSILSPGDIVVSGACHLGGVDKWAEEEAKKLGLKTRIFPPETLSWDGGVTIGYKQRNIQIAEESDVVVCIVVDVLPASFKGREFLYCYHCHTNAHVKSGGCWTARYARSLGKPAY